MCAPPCPHAPPLRRFRGDAASFVLARWYTGRRRLGSPFFRKVLALDLKSESEAAAEGGRQWGHATTHKTEDGRGSYCCA